MASCGEAVCLDKACRARAVQFKGCAKELLFIFRLNWSVLAGTVNSVQVVTEVCLYLTFTLPHEVKTCYHTHFTKGSFSCKNKYMGIPNCCTIWQFYTVCKRAGVRRLVSCQPLALLCLSVSKAKPSTPARSPLSHSHCLPGPWPS